MGRSAPPPRAEERIPPGPAGHRRTAASSVIGTHRAPPCQALELRSDSLSDLRFHAISRARPDACIATAWPAAACKSGRSPSPRSRSRTLAPAIEPEYSLPRAATRLGCCSAARAGAARVSVSRRVGFSKRTECLLTRVFRPIELTISRSRRLRFRPGGVVVGATARPLRHESIRACFDSRAIAVAHRHSRTGRRRHACSSIEAAAAPARPLKA